MNDRVCAKIPCSLDLRSSLSLPCLALRFLFATDPSNDLFAISVVILLPECHFSSFISLERERAGVLSVCMQPKLHSDENEALNV